MLSPVQRAHTAENSKGNGSPSFQGMNMIIYHQIFVRIGLIVVSVGTAPLTARHRGGAQKQIYTIFLVFC